MTSNILTTSVLLILCLFNRKQDARLSEEDLERAKFERKFFYQFLKERFISVLNSVKEKGRSSSIIIIIVMKCQHVWFSFDF